MTKSKHAIRPSATYNPGKATEMVRCTCRDLVPSAQIELHVREGNAAR